MDEFDLIQEAVVNWESLEEVAEVETWECGAGDVEGRLFVARITPMGQDSPLYVAMRTTGSTDRAIEELIENGRPVSWSRPGFSLN